MATTRGKLEGLITVPSGGWTATVSGNTATLAAGTYYHSSLGSAASDFLAASQTAIDTAADLSGAVTTTLTASIGENGTGIATLTFSGARSVTWVSTDWRDVLGYTGNLSSGTSHVATQSMRSVWLPSCYPQALNSGTAWHGHKESDFRAVENAAGYVFAHQGQYKTVHDSLAWPAVTRAKTWIANESTVNQSLERFWLDTFWGVAGWTRPGGPVRWYPDADDDATYITYRASAGVDIFRPEPTVADFAGGPWVCRMPRLVEVPS